MFFFILNHNFIAIVPEIFLVISINIVLVYSVVFCTSNYLNYPLLLNNVTWLCIQVLIFTFLLNVNNQLYNLTIFDGLLIVDLFGISVKNFVLLSCISILLFSLNYNRYDFINNFEFPLLLILAILGTLLLISSYDLITMYLSLELQSFCSYILTALKRNSEFSSEAGLKYFILGAFSSGFLLFGCSLLYGLTGTTNYKNLFLFSFNISSSLYNIDGFLLGIIFIAISFLFKVSAAPFHFWSPDIYEGSPTIVTLFFVAIPKLGVFTFFLRLFFVSFFFFFFFWQYIIIFASFFSMLIGSLGAIWQLKLKRLIAFSGINHVGLMLICLCCSSFEGVFSLIFYLLVYIIMSLSAFLLLIVTRKNYNLKKLKYIEDLITVSKANRFLGTSLIISFFSIAGIPPFIGFFSKMFVFFCALGQSIYFLSFVGLFTSVISCFYYLRIIQLSFFEHTNNWISIKKINRESSFLISMLTFSLFLFGLHSKFFVIFVHNLSFYLCL